MATSLTPYESVQQATEFAKKMKKPWCVYKVDDDYGYFSLEDNSMHDYQSFISDDDFTDALYEDAEAFYAKAADDKGFDIRDTLRERMVYFMMDEELYYLLTGTFNPETDLKAVNIVRKTIGMKPLSKITPEQAAENRANVPPEKLFQWMLYDQTLMQLEPYASVPEATIEKLKYSTKKQKEDDHIRHGILIKEPDKLTEIFGLT